MRVFVGSTLLCLVAAGLTGCGGSQPAGAVTEKPVITAQVVDPVPGEVELTTAKAAWQPGDIVQFDIAYKFTKGSPSKHYMVNFAFPGSEAIGQRPMEAWETKPEGMIITGLPMSDHGVEKFAITFSEADSPDRGYTVISNTLTGTIEPLPAAP